MEFKTFNNITGWHAKNYKQFSFNDGCYVETATESILICKNICDE